MEPRAIYARSRDRRRQQPANKSKNNDAVFFLHGNVSEESRKEISTGARCLVDIRRKRQEEVSRSHDKWNVERSPLTYLPSRARTENFCAKLQPRLEAKERNLNFAVSYALSRIRLILLAAAHPLRSGNNAQNVLDSLRLNLCRFCVWHIDLKSILLPSSKRLCGCVDAPQFRVTCVRINLNG